MKEHSDSTMFYSYCIPATKSTKWTDPTRVSIHVHKVDGPHEGSLLDQSTKWTDPTRAQNSNLSIKWMDPTRVQNSNIHKVDGPHEGSKFKHVHKMDGPH